MIKKIIIAIIILLLCLVPTIMDKEGFFEKIHKKIKSDNIDKAVDYILELADKDSSIITIDVLKQIHRLTTDKIMGQKAGQLRDHDIIIRGERKYSAADDIQRNLEEFIEWLHTATGDPVIIAADAHVRFVKVHPFSNGNGRTARLLMNLLLLQNGLPSALILKKDRKRYIPLVEKARHGQPEEFYALVREAIAR